MKPYLYANFTDSSINYGNYIIDYATKQFIKNNLSDEISFVEYDSFGDVIPEGDFQGLFIPGCTMLTPGENSSLSKIGAINYESFCLAGSLWYSKRDKYFLIKKRLVRYTKGLVPDLSIVQNLTGIIGCRDSYTYDILKSSALNVLYTGCPTLFLDNSNVCDNDYVLFSFGRGDYYKQVSIGNRIGKKSRIIGVSHEEGDTKRLMAAGWKHPIVDFNGDIELYLSYFKNASYVISGRLHGILPSVAYGKKCMYFGTNDTRTTILNDLGIPIYGLRDLKKFKDLCLVYHNPDLLNFFKKNMIKVSHSIFSKTNE
jgi:hypothetical protein